MTKTQQSHQLVVGKHNLAGCNTQRKARLSLANSDSAQLKGVLLCFIKIPVFQRTRNIPRAWTELKFSHHAHRFEQSIPNSDNTFPCILTKFTLAAATIIRCKIKHLFFQLWMNDASKLPTASLSKSCLYDFFKYFPPKIWHCVRHTPTNTYAILPVAKTSVHPFHSENWHRCFVHHDWLTECL